MENKAVIPHTSAAPGASERFRSDAEDIHDLYRKALKMESQRRESALRKGLTTVPIVVLGTTALGIFMGMSFWGVILLSIIGLSCGPGLTLCTMTASKVFKGRKLKKMVLTRAQKLGLTAEKSLVLWKSVCRQLDALDRDNLSSGKTRHLLSMSRNPKLQELVAAGEMNWEETVEQPQKRLPGT